MKKKNGARSLSIVLKTMLLLTVMADGVRASDLNQITKEMKNHSVKIIQQELELLKRLKYKKSERGSSERELSERELSDYKQPKSDFLKQLPPFKDGWYKDEKGMMKTLFSEKNDVSGFDDFKIKDLHELIKNLNLDKKKDLDAVFLNSANVKYDKEMLEKFNITGDNLNSYVKDGFKVGDLYEESIASELRGFIDSLCTSTPANLGHLGDKDSLLDGVSGFIDGLVDRKAEIESKMVGKLTDLVTKSIKSKKESLKIGDEIDSKVSAQYSVKKWVETHLLKNDGTLSKIGECFQKLCKIDNLDTDFTERTNLSEALKTESNLKDSVEHIAEILKINVINQIKNADNKRPEKLKQLDKTITDLDKKILLENTRLIREKTCLKTEWGNHHFGDDKKTLNGLLQSFASKKFAHLFNRDDSVKNDFQIVQKDLQILSNKVKKLDDSSEEYLNEITKLAKDLLTNIENIENVSNNNPVPNTAEDIKKIKKTLNDIVDNQTIKSINSLQEGLKNLKTSLDENKAKRNDLRLGEVEVTPEKAIQSLQTYAALDDSIQKAKKDSSLENIEAVKDAVNALQETDGTSVAGFSHLDEIIEKLKKIDTIKITKNTFEGVLGEDADCDKLYQNLIDVGFEHQEIAKFVEESVNSFLSEQSDAISSEIKSFKIVDVFKFGEEVEGMHLIEDRIVDFKKIILSQMNQRIADTLKGIASSGSIEKAFVAVKKLGFFIDEATIDKSILDDFLKKITDQRVSEVRKKLTSDGENTFNEIVKGLHTELERAMDLRNISIPGSFLLSSIQGDVSPEKGKISDLKTAIQKLFGEKMREAFSTANLSEISASIINMGYLMKEICDEKDADGFRAANIVYQRLKSLLKDNIVKTGELLEKNLEDRKQPQVFQTTSTQQYVTIGDNQFNDFVQKIANSNPALTDGQFSQIMEKAMNTSTLQTNSGGNEHVKEEKFQKKNQANPLIDDVQVFNSLIKTEKDLVTPARLRNYLSEGGSTPKARIKFAENNPDWLSGLKDWKDYLGRQLQNLKNLINQKSTTKKRIEITQLKKDLSNVTKMRKDIENLLKKMPNVKGNKGGSQPLITNQNEQNTEQTVMDSAGNDHTQNGRYELVKKEHSRVKNQYDMIKPVVLKAFMSKGGNTLLKKVAYAKKKPQYLDAIKNWDNYLNQNLKNLFNKVEDLKNQKATIQTRGEMAQIKKDVKNMNKMRKDIENFLKKMPNAKNNKSESQPLISNQNEAKPKADQSKSTTPAA